MYSPKIVPMYNLCSGLPLHYCASVARMTQGQDVIERKFAPEDDTKLIKQLYKRGHHAPFEFAYFTLAIYDVSRAFMAQITRHRHFSFMCTSQHFQDYRDYPIICEHPGVYNVSEAMFKHYENFIEAGVPKHEARMCLPNSAGVNMIMSGNIRAWADMLRLRLCKRNVPEMVTFAKKAHTELKNFFPSLFNLVGANCGDAYMDGCRDGGLCRKGIPISNEVNMS